MLGISILLIKRLLWYGLMGMDYGIVCVEMLCCFIRENKFGIGRGWIMIFINNLILSL